jgi:alpha-D-ribose 1-methylphosphonate 5-triphosphate synthase subunit PhnL
VLTVNALSKHFRLHSLGGKLIEGCREVSFEARPGELVALVGPSGCGKSTVLKCIHRTYLPSAGRIAYHSDALGPIDLAEAPDRTVLEVRRREIALVSQFLRVIPRVSALQVVAEPLLRRRSAPPAEARARACELLERLRIPRALHETFPVTFSGGEQQRVNIARAVVWRPRLLLLDEPTAALDAKAIAVVLELLRELREAGTAQVGVFHDPRIFEAADRVVRMDGVAA